MEMTRAHSQHVAFVAHELRSPLMSAFLAVAALRKSGRVEDEWALGMLSRNLNALRELIDQVLTADRLAGQISADREAFDLSRLLQQLAAEARLAAQQSQVEIVLQAGTTTVEVEDACGGLPAGNAAQLFEPFVQRGEDRSGFGLGLAIVKQALEAHGGRVSVRNLPGTGCVFCLELPEPKSA
jgi:signal transduction histidine kinase